MNLYILEEVKQELTKNIEELVIGEDKMSEEIINECFGDNTREITKIRAIREFISSETGVYKPEQEKEQGFIKNPRKLYRLGEALISSDIRKEANEKIKIYRELKVMDQDEIAKEVTVKCKKWIKNKLGK